MRLTEEQMELARNHPKRSGTELGGFKIFDIVKHKSGLQGRVRSIYQDMGVLMLDVEYTNEVTGELVVRRTIAENWTVVSTEEQQNI